MWHVRNKTVFDEEVANVSSIVNHVTLNTFHGAYSWQERDVRQS